MNLINKAIDKIMDSTWEKKNYKFTYPMIDIIPSSNGSGIYVAHFIGNTDTLIGKLIKKLSGDYSHSILFWHEPLGIFRYLNNNEILRLIKKYKKYYTGDNQLKYIKNTNSLVLGSVDSIGMNYFNFSHYTFRKMIIHKLPVDEITYKKIVNYMLSEKVMNKNYNYTGLAFWWLYKMFDDERAWYCSKQVKDVALKFEIDLCPGESNPSSTQLAEYALKNFKIIYDSRGRL